MVVVLVVVVDDEVVVLQDHPEPFHMGGWLIQPGGDIAVVPEGQVPILSVVEQTVKMPNCTGNDPRGQFPP